MQTYAEQKKVAGLNEVLPEGIDIMRLPLLALLLVPTAPLALWCCLSGPLSRPRGASAIAIQSALVLVVLIVAGALLAMMHSGL